MSRIAVLALAGALFAACTPAVAPIPLAPSAPTLKPAVAQWSDGLAESNLRAALERRGRVPAVVHGEMTAITFDPERAIVHQDGGRYETLVGGGAWLVASEAGPFWVFESGAVLPADEVSMR